MLAPNDEKDVSRVKRYVRESRFAFTVLPKADGINKRYAVDGFPTLYYVDRQGKVAGMDLGFPGRTSFESKVRQLMK